MKIDTYTKGVLTIIAINLTFMTLKDLELIPKTYANEKPLIDSFELNKNYGLVPLNEDGSINVKINSGQIIDVNISQINGYDTFYKDTDGAPMLLPVHDSIY